MLEHSKAWINFTWTCVGIAYTMLALGLAYMPVDLATKGYLAMGILFLSGSLVTIVKTMHDIKIGSEFTSKLEKARQEKILNEYVSQN